VLDGIGTALDIWSLIGATTDEFAAKNTTIGSALRDITKNHPQLSEFASLDLWTDAATSLTAISTNTVLSPVNAAIHLATGKSITITGDDVKRGLAPVINGGTVGGVYVPGLGDFTKDVILDPIHETAAGAKAVGSWIGKTWNSIW
jgi:hypothetical protein